MDQMRETVKKEVVETLAPSVEEAINEYITLCIEAKKDELKASLQPISVQLEQIRQELDKSLRQFYLSFSAGYQVLSNVLEIDPEKVALMQDSSYIQKGFDEGKTVQELLCISQG